MNSGSCLSVSWSCLHLDPGLLHQSAHLSPVSLNSYRLLLWPSVTHSAKLPQMLSGPQYWPHFFDSSASRDFNCHSTLAWWPCGSLMVIWEPPHNVCPELQEQGACLRGQQLEEQIHRKYNYPTRLAGVQDTGQRQVRGHLFCVRQLWGWGGKSRDFQISQHSHINAQQLDTLGTFLDLSDLSSCPYPDNEDK